MSWYLCLSNHNTIAYCHFHCFKMVRCVNPRSTVVRKYGGAGKRLRLSADGAKRTRVYVEGVSNLLVAILPRTGLLDASKKAMLQHHYTPPGYIPYASDALVVAFVCYMRGRIPASQLPLLLYHQFSQRKLTGCALTLLAYVEYIHGIVQQADVFMRGGCVPSDLSNPVTQASTLCIERIVYYTKKLQDDTSSVPWKAFPTDPTLHTQRICLVKTSVSHSCAQVGAANMYPGFLVPFVRFPFGVPTSTSALTESTVCVITNIEAADVSLLDILCAAACMPNVRVILFVTTGLPYEAVVRYGEMPRNAIEHIAAALDDANVVDGDVIDLIRPARVVGHSLLLDDARTEDGLLSPVSILAVAQHAPQHPNVILLRQGVLGSNWMNEATEEAMGCARLLQPHGRILVTVLTEGFKREASAERHFDFRVRDYYSKTHSGKRVYETVSSGVHKKDYGRHACTGFVGMFTGVPSVVVDSMIVLVGRSRNGDAGLANSIRACAARCTQRLFIVMPNVSWATLVGVNSHSPTDPAPP